MFRRRLKGTIHERTRRFINLQEKQKILNMRFQYQLKGVLFTIRKRVKSYGVSFVAHSVIILDYKAASKALRFWVVFISWVGIESTDFPPCSKTYVPLKFRFYSFLASIKS